MTNLFYNLSAPTFKIEGEDQTIIRIYENDEYYNQVRVASFDFRYNEGWFKNVNGKEREVKRFSTIMNYLFSVEENLFWSPGTVETAKNNAKQLKKKMEREYKEELKQRDENKAIELINRINNKDDFFVNQVEKFEAMTQEELLKVVTNTVKKASKKTVKAVMQAIYNLIDKVNNPVQEVEIVATEVETTVKDSNVKINTINENVTYSVNAQSFDTYNEAYNYIISNCIPSTYILNSKSNITMDQFHELHYTLNNEASKLTIEQLNLLKDHVQSLPYDLDSENALIKINRWIERKERQRHNRDQEKQRQIELAEASYKLVELMKSKGLHSLECDYGWKYEYNGKVFTLLSRSSGVTNETYSDFVNSIYNECFVNQVQYS